MKNWKNFAAHYQQPEKGIKKASKAIEDFALISMQDNDPIFRLNMSGDIILNPAAKALVDFIYQEQRYTAAGNYGRTW